MWNKSIAVASRCVIICLLVLAVDQVSARNTGEYSCSAVKRLLDTVPAATTQKGMPSICNGGCCSGIEERYLQNKSISSFVDSLRIQSKEISHKMVDTSVVFKGYISQLFEETKSKTINIFAKVYPRMTPVSRQLLEKLFVDIKSANGHSVSAAMGNFFRNLFPIAYHHKLYAESGEKASPAASIDFNEDYKRCLVHSYESLNPFGDIPRTLSRSVDRSLTASNMFIVALERGAEVLASVDRLDEISFEPKCSSHLLKMNYCQECNGAPKVKSCRGYCINVMRGCLTQHVGSLDRPWTTYAQSLEALLHIVRSKDGYETVLRGLDGRLSEAVMHFMQHGSELEQKVKKLCGTPSMSSVKLPLQSTAPATATSSGHKISPPDSEMLQFLVTIDGSKNIYTQIVDSYCDDHEEFQLDDKECWMGDRVGHYSQTVMEPGMTTQKYNPEVPYEGEGFRVNSQVNELVDKLISNRQKMSNVMSQHSGHTDSDGMISDMAEGSGLWRSEFPDDSDFGPDGSGSGDGYSGLSKVPVPERPTYQPPVVVHNPRDNHSAASTAQVQIVVFLAINVLSLLLLRSH